MSRSFEFARLDPDGYFDGDELFAALDAMVESEEGEVEPEDESTRPDRSSEQNGPEETASTLREQLTNAPVRYAVVEGSDWAGTDVLTSCPTWCVDSVGGVL
jgi:hypothetical protein